MGIANTEFFRLMSRLIDRLQAACESEGIRRVEIAGVSIDWAETMRYPLLLQLVTAWQKPPAQLRTNPYYLGRMRWALRDIWQGVRTCGGKRTHDFSTLKDSHPLVICPRTKAHIPDLMAIASNLKDSHHQHVVIALSDKALKGTLQSYEQKLVEFLPPGSPFFPKLFSVGWKLDRHLERIVHTLIDSSTDTLTPELARATILSVFRNYWMHFARLSEAIIRFCKTTKPKVLFVGNHYAHDGKLICLIAKELGIPSMCIQHGGVLPADPQWDGCHVNLMLAWGESSKSIITTCGQKENEVAVTGSPGLDPIFGSMRAERIEDRKTLLVATSGAGDLVSYEQHLTFVKLLLSAAKMTPDIQWIVKLNRKDKEVYYVDETGVTPPNLQLKRGPWGSRMGRLEIYDYLERSSALLTVSSSSGLDAMAVGLPVIAVLLEQADQVQADRHEYFIKGCVHTVSTAEALAESARLACSTGLEGPFRERAKNYIQTYYSSPGQSTKRAGEAILNYLKAHS